MQDAQCSAQCALSIKKQESGSQFCVGRTSNNIKMKSLWMLILFMHCPTLTWASSCEVQEKFQTAVGAIGAAVGEIPILSTAVNLVDVYLE